MLSEDLTGAERARIKELFDRPELHRLFAAVRDRLARAGSAPAHSVLLKNMDEAERRMLAEVHGWSRIPGSDVRIDLARLDVALRESRAATGLRNVVEALGGPIADRPAEREQATQARDRMWSNARDRIEARPELCGWIDELRARGLVKRAAGPHSAGSREAELLDASIGVVARLPSAEGIPLSVLATETTGDAHSLDHGRPLTMLVLRAVARLVARTAVPTDAAQRRALWAEVGVQCDALSCHVLAFGLRPLGDGRLSRHLRENADAGEPSHLTLRELSRSSLALPAGTDVFVCENPAVVAVAADELGARCAPLVCVEGVPSTAAWCLLRSLARSGSRLRFHADFDWDGIKIGNLLVQRLKARAWRFGGCDYREAAREAPQGTALSGTPVQALWDDNLMQSMEQHGYAVSEEIVIARLLKDLNASMRRTFEEEE